MSWHQELRSVLKLNEGSALLECPSRQDDSVVNTYGINTCIMTPSWSLRTSHRTNLGDLQTDYYGRPFTVKPFSQLILFADKSGSTDASLRSSEGTAFMRYFYNTGPVDVWEIWQRHNSFGSLRHGTKAGRAANAVFMDGHVDHVINELKLKSGHWFFGNEPEAFVLTGAPCCQ
jgi:prepilin-type processing-associated H-X9-DG protein